MSINRAQHTVATAREEEKERGEKGEGRACAKGSLQFTVEPQLGLGLGLYDGFLWAIAQVRERSERV